MKKSFIFTFVMTILAGIIGAGFASGKEIVAFFGAAGYWAIPFLVIAGGLFFCCFYVFSWIGKFVKPKSISDLTSAVFGRAGMFVDFGFILSSFITLSSMLAGCDSIGTLIFGTGYNFCYISILTAIIVAVIVAVGLKYIYKITDFIMPVMLGMIFIVLMLHLFTKAPQQVAPENINFNFFSILIYSILYVSMNSFYNIFIIAKSSEYMDKKQIGKASTIASSILFFLILLLFISIMRGGNIVFLSDMPMINIAFGLGSPIGIIYSIVLWLAIFTTICISAYTIREWLGRAIKNKFMCSVIVLTLGFIFSRFGFANIVKIFYPIEGIFGLFFIIYLIVFYFKNKKIYEAKQNAIIDNYNLSQSKALDVTYKDFSKTETKIENSTQEKQKTENSKTKQKQSTSKKSVGTKQTQKKKTLQNKFEIDKDDINSIKIEHKKEGKVVTKKTSSGKVLVEKSKK